MQGAVHLPCLYLSQSDSARCGSVSPAPSSFSPFATTAVIICTTHGGQVLKEVGGTLNPDRTALARVEYVQTVSKCSFLLSNAVL